MKDIVFETARLYVRPFRTEDAQALYANHCEAAVKKWIPNESYANLEEAQDAAGFFARLAAEFRLPYVLAVAQKDSDELIGDCGINEVDGHTGEIEIGYCISEKSCGNGYATELVQAMTEFVFKTFDAKIMYGRVICGNNASVRVLEKSGYMFERTEFGAPDDPYGMGMLIFKKERP